MFEVKTGIARPGPKQLGGAVEKYPLPSMKVGDFFVVPKSEMLEGDNEKKFRNRINQSVRTYKQRTNASAHLEPDYDEATYTPVDFTVMILGKPPEEHPDAWEPGDVGVWRDA